MKVFCINLDERPEKWELSKKEAEKLHLDPVRVSATKASPGFVGCRLSHLGLLADVKEYVFMVIEDDIKVCCENPSQALQDSMSELPNDWDMLYLGATLNTPLEKYSDHLYRIKQGWTTHAIIYNNQNGVVDYILNADIRKIDVFYSDDVQEKFNCFITYPMILTQREGFSDVIRKDVDYKVIQERYKTYVK